MRLAQIVYTLTQFPTVTKGVIFRIDGVQTCTPTLVQANHTRDYGDLLPPILVTSPALNQEVGSPVVLRESANVFEANVGIEILDENGDVLVQRFTTATCGTGCRGTLRARVAYDVDTRRTARSSSTTTMPPAPGPPERGPHPRPTPAVNLTRPTRGVPSDVEARLPPHSPCVPTPAPLGVTP